MKNLVIICVLVLTWNFSSYSYGTNPLLNDQIVSHLNDENELKKKWDEALGTFQFEVLKRRPDRSLMQINISIIDEILNNRSQTEVTYISYNEYTRIKILPNEIIEKEFEELELIVYVDSFE